MDNRANEYERINSLVMQGQDGDMQAIADLCVVYDKLISKSVWRAITIDPDLRPFADDLRAEAFESMWYLVKVYQPDKSQFSAYLQFRLHFQLVKRGQKCIGRNTSHRGLVTTSLDEILAAQDGFEATGWTEPGALDVALDRLEWRTVFAQAFDILTPLQRKAVEAYYSDGCSSYAEAATASGLSVKQVDNALMLALPKLRRWFRARMPEEFA